MIIFSLFTWLFYYNYTLLQTYYYIILLFHYFQLLKSLLHYYYMIITCSLQMGNYVTLISLLQNMQLGCFHYYDIFTLFNLLLL